MAEEIKYVDDKYDHLVRDIDNAIYNNKIEITCSICGKKYLSSYTYWKQNRNKKDKIWRCKECNSKYKSNINKNRWENYSPAELDKISKKQSETQSAYWARLSDNEIHIRLKSFIEAGNEWYNNLPQEEKNERIKKRKEWWNSLSKEEQDNITKGIKLYHENLTEDDRKRLSELKKEWFRNLPSEISDKIISDLKKNNKKWLDNLSIEEKKMYYKNNGSYLQKFWDNISDEQLLDWFNKTIQGRINSDIIKSNKTPTELEFINYLNIYKIDYDFQYANKTFPKEFYETFDKHKFPYHRWDFKVHTLNKDILIDIDGSEHMIPIGKCFTKDGIDIGLTVFENDSKRPYQTDGLDAYIVQCYDDNLTYDTPVANIKTNEKMTMKSFIVLMDILNLSDKELKETIKEGI